jgi:hypothetical protein
VVRSRAVPALVIAAPPRTLALVGALLMGRRILIGENLFGFQVGKFLVTVIAAGPSMPT